MKLKHRLSKIPFVRSGRWDLLLFFVFSYLFLFIYLSDLVFRLQEQSIFLFTLDFLRESLSHPGGFLAWAGSFLTQFFYFPALGILFFSLIILLIQFLNLRLAGKSEAGQRLALLPGMLFLVLLTGLSYNLYVLYIHDLVYSQSLGYLLILGGLWLYNQLKNGLLRWITTLLYMPLLFPLLGFYAVAGGLLLALTEVLQKKDSGKKSYLRAVAGLMLAAGIPPLFMHWFYPSLNTLYTYTWGAPVLEFFSAWASLWIPVLGSLVITALILVAAHVDFGKTIFSKMLSGWTRLVAVGLCIAATLVFTNHDPNFREQIRMERAIGESDWNQVLKIAASHRQTPTRSIVLYRNIALSRTNQLMDKMFTYPDGADSIHVPRPIKAAQTNAPMLYYEYGLPNYSYRWSMELTVQYGLKVDYLRYMIKCALLNGEINLARKYLHIVSQTLFHRNWAEKYQAFANDPIKISEDPEFKQISELLVYSEKDWEQDLAVEPCIHFHYNHLNSGSVPMLEMAMASILSGKSVELFWPLLSSYVQFHPVLPRHVQEAILLFSANQQVHGLERIQLDPVITSRFQDFVQRINRSSQQPTGEAPEQIKKEFGDTYWYYFLFVKAN